MSIFKNAVIITILIETATVFSRFILKLESTRDTDFIKHFTFGFRIHHGYYGIIILLLYLLKRDVYGKYSDLIIALAIALIASDLIHHFLVLWPIIGDHQFDIKYPK